MPPPRRCLKDCRSASWVAAPGLPDLPAGPVDFDPVAGHRLVDPLAGRIDSADCATGRAADSPVDRLVVRLVVRPVVRPVDLAANRIESPLVVLVDSAGPTESPTAGLADSAGR